MSQEIDSIKRMELKPGDILVLKCERHLSLFTRDKLRQQVEEQFPDHKCVVLSPDLSLEIIAPEELPSLLSESKGIENA